MSSVKSVGVLILAMAGFLTLGSLPVLGPAHGNGQSHHLLPTVVAA